MKKVLYIIAAIALTACGGNTSGQNQKTIEEFVTNFYNNYVFGSGELDSIAGNFDQAVLDRLQKAYDEEYCDGGPAYAVWLFRTGQNGSDEQSIDSIKADGNDRYTVYLTDGGTPCSCQMHIVMKGGKPVVMDFKTDYDKPENDFDRKLLTLGDLDGEWRVMAVDLEGVTYATVKMTFNANDKTFGAYAGCNQIGGQMSQGERTTEMYCDEETSKLEKQIMQALGKVRSFYGMGEDVYMADENDTAVVPISRN